MEVNAVNSVGNTPLHDAASSGRAEAVEALARAGAEVDAANKKGETPLHEAAFKGHADALHFDSLAPCLFC